MVSQVNCRDLPPGLSQKVQGLDWPTLSHIGDLDLLAGRMLGLFCSMRCPGEVILKAYDLARAFREAKIPVIGGFHSPMERECFEILGRGSQPIVICPARSLRSLRVPSGWRAPLEQKRLLVISPFPDRAIRATAESASRRNAFVAALADELLILHASPGGRIEELCLQWLGRSKRVHLLEGPPNETLSCHGARIRSIEDVVTVWRCHHDKGDYWMAHESPGRTT